MAMEGPQEQQEPFSLMVTYDPILDSIHDSIAGTTTTYKYEAMRDPVTNQPITNSAGKPLTYLKQTAVPKDGVTPMVNKDGVEYVMGVLNSVVNKTSSFANYSLSDIVYAANSAVAALSNITLNSQKYGISNMAAWYNETKIIRNFLFGYLSAVKNGGLKDWSERILGVQYGMSMGGMPEHRQEGILSRLFQRKQMTNTDSQYGDNR